MRLKLVYSLFLLNLVRFIESDDTTNRGLSWYESLPAVAMDYKVHIDAGWYYHIAQKICFFMFIYLSYLI